MTYAYVIVIYVTYNQIYYYCLLGHGLPKDLWWRFLYIKIFLATLYVIKCLLAFEEHVHLPCNSQVYYVTIR